MSIKHWLLITLCSFLLFSCENSEEKILRENFEKYRSAEIAIEGNKKSTGAILQYIQQEKYYNEKYTSDLKSLIESRFEKQLEKFEEEELGVIKGYKNMFSWLLSSKQEWEDEQILLANKYFNNIEIYQELHGLYLAYIDDIQKLRMQFKEQQFTNIETRKEINLPKENVGVNLSEHTKNNIIIEIGTEALQWFLGFVIIQIVLLFVDKIVGPWGCLIDIIVFVLVIIVSSIITYYNDNKLLNEIEEQHVKKEIIIDYDKILNDLNKNTTSFYENP